METSGYMVQDLTLLHEFLPQGERGKEKDEVGKGKRNQKWRKRRRGVNKNKKNKEGEQKEG